jgi:hypothetical protein
MTKHACSFEPDRLRRTNTVIAPSARSIPTTGEQPAPRTDQPTCRSTRWNTSGGRVR